MGRQIKRIAFQNLQHQTALEQDGYFAEPFLTPDALSACLDVYKNSKQPGGGLKYNTLEINSYSHRKQVAQQLNEILEPYVKPYLEDYKFIGFNFAIKEGFGPAFPPHIDDIHVDESKYTAVNIWVPLVDVTEKNGGLYIVPRSHKLPADIRGIGLPFQYQEHDELIQSRKNALPLSAGDGLFFNGSLIHGSPNNQTPLERPAIIMSLIPKEAQPIVYMSYDTLDSNEAEKFHGPEEFYWKIEIGKRPEGFESLGMYKQSLIPLSESEFVRTLDS